MNWALRAAQPTPPRPRPSTGMRRRAASPPSLRYQDQWYSGLDSQDEVRISEDYYKKKSDIEDEKKSDIDCGNESCLRRAIRSVTNSVTNLGKSTVPTVKINYEGGRRSKKHRKSRKSRKHRKHRKHNKSRKY